MHWNIDDKPHICSWESVWVITTPWSLQPPEYFQRWKKITPLSTLALMMQLGLSGKESFRSFMRISADMMVMMVNWLWWKGSLRSFMKTSTEQKVWLPFSPRRRLVLFIFSRQLRPPHTSQIKLLSSKSCPRILLPYETSLLIAWKVSLTVWK